MNPNEQKAAELMEHWLSSGERQPFFGPSPVAYFGTSPLEQWLATHIVPKLATPDHEAALAACEAYSAKREYWHGRTSGDKEHDAIVAIGRRSLEAKKPKERYYVFHAPHAYKMHPWAVLDGPEYSAMAVAYFYTEAVARAYAADMNAKEAGR